MTSYNGKPVTVNVPVQTIVDRFGDLTSLQNSIDKLPEEQRSRLGDTRFEKDAIVIKNPQAGEIRFQVTERTSEMIKMVSGGIMPMEMLISLQAIDERHTTVTTTINIEIPLMLRPLVGPYLQKAADQFGTLMANITAQDTTDND